MYYNYHATAKKLIADGHLTGYNILEKYNKISPCLLLYFDNHRPMPIRECRWNEYLPLDNAVYGENKMNQPFEHISYEPKISVLKSEQASTFDYVNAVAAKCIDMADEAICEAIIEAAKNDGITDLYLLDKKFVIEAIREKLEKKDSTK